MHWRLCETGSAGRYQNRYKEEDMATKQKKCANPDCNCNAEQGSKYCSAG
jgi:hypothetical protein